MLELYHGTTSVCAQKVRLTLAEKGLEWQSHLLELNGDHLTPEYLKINPNGVVPTLVHDGTIIVESTVIIHYLDDLFPDPPLMPRAARPDARPSFQKAHGRIYPSGMHRLYVCNGQPRPLRRLVS